MFGCFGGGDWEDEDDVIQLNNHNAMYNLAIIYYNLFDYDRTIFYLYQAIEFNNPEALFKLSYYYDKGLCNLKVNKVKSFELLILAVRYKSKKAILKLAKMYEHGYFVDKNIELANLLYEQIDNVDEPLPLFFNNMV